MFGPGNLISERSAWKGSAIGGKAGLVSTFTPAHLAAVHDLLETTRHLPIDAVTREMFDAPGLNEFLAGVADEMAHGRGAVILHGLSREAYSDEELTRIFWGIGTHLGVAAPQNNKGDRIDHVRDMANDNPLGRRQYGTEELIFHTDGITGQNLGLLCLQTSKSGGLSLLASGLAIHNEFVRHHPDLLELLYEGYPYHRKGKQRPDMPLISPYPVPVFSCIDGTVSVQYIRDYMLKAGEMLGGMPPKFRAALDQFDAYANDPDMNVSFTLEPGEIELVNNRAVLHSRTQFEDYPEPERKRHLVRLWMDVPNGRPYKQEMDYLERGPAFKVAVPA